MKVRRHLPALLRATLLAVAFTLGAVVVSVFAVNAADASPSIAPMESVPYYLPLPAGSSALVTQGNGGLYTHIRRRLSEFAWDFSLPTGSLVVAAAEGTVVALEQGFQGGGLSDAYSGRTNYVVLAHADGRYSLYMHLAYRGVLVEVGERVYAGQGIALSGATGYASGPHLHFQVQNTSAPSGAQSVPVSFVDAGVPVLGDQPVSSNLYNPPPQAPRLATPGLMIGPSGDLLTHQGFPVRLQWVTEIADTTPASAGPSPRPAGGTSPESTPVRVVTADVSGERRQVNGRAAADVAGPFTVWAEYFDGAFWRIAADAAGRPAAVTRAAVARDVFLTSPGFTATPLAVAPGGSISASFSLVDLGADDVSLYDLTLTATRLGGGEIETAAPIRRHFYLRSGERVEWQGTVTLTEPGVYVLSPHVFDPGGAPVPLPAAEWGDSEQVTVVVTLPTPPDPDDPPAFADVPLGHPAHDAAEILAARGLLTGYPDGRGGHLLRPDEPVTRAQFTKLLALTLGIAVSEADLCPFVDVERSGPDSLYPDNFIAAAFRAGLAMGLPGEPPRFAPYALVTRRQAVTMVTRGAPEGDWSIPGDEWTPATRGETVILLASLL